MREFPQIGEKHKSTRSKCLKGKSEPIRAVVCLVEVLKTGESIEIQFFQMTHGIT
jgi:hypothetical protein